MGAGHKRTRYQIPYDTNQRVRRTARMVLIHNGKVLLIKDWRGDTLPGGKVEEGESYEQGAVRETEEEAGLVVTSTMHFLTLEEPYQRTEFFLAADWHGDVRGSEEGRPKWVDPRELVKKRAASNDRDTAEALDYLFGCGLL